MYRKVAPEVGWTPENFIEFLQTVPEDKLRYTEARKEYGEAVVVAGYRLFGSWRRAVQMAERRYPENGHYQWRTKYYRQDQARFQEDLNAGLVPVKKLSSTWDFCREQTMKRPIPVLSRRLCAKCKIVFAPRRRIYCDRCRPEAQKESQRGRNLRWRMRQKKKEIGMQIF